MFEYWVEEPSVHDIARLWVKYKPKKLKQKKTIEGKPVKQHAPAELSLTEQAFLHQRGAQIRTFDNLPLHIQEWAIKNTKAKLQN